MSSQLVELIVDERRAHSISDLCQATIVSWASTFCNTIRTLVSPLHNPEEMSAAMSSCQSLPEVLGFPLHTTHMVQCQMRRLPFHFPITRLVNPLVSSSFRMGNLKQCGDLDRAYPCFCCHRDDKSRNESSVLSHWKCSTEYGAKNSLRRL